MGRLPPPIDRGRRRGGWVSGPLVTHLATAEELSGSSVVVDGDAYRHLFRARRLAVGDRVRVVDGYGDARWGEVAEVVRQRARLDLGEPAPSNEPPYRLELLVAALRSERASWLVEKATEIGASAVRFLGCERTPRKYGKANLERLRRVARAALEQSHRSRLPEVTRVHPWADLPTLLAAVGDRIVLDPDGDHPEPWQLHSEAGAVLIGPEGGWSDDEREQLRSFGARGAVLGPRVLRVETAAMVAAARLLLR